MTHSYSGRCQCECVTVKLELPEPLECYTPRKCDCDFCIASDGAYVSDPRGTLSITAIEPLEQIKQGDEIASMVFCSRCGEMISATAVLGGKLKGNVRVGILDEENKLQPYEMISPKKLSPGQKIARWGRMWMPVKIA